MRNNCLVKSPILWYFVREKAVATHSSTLAWKIPWTEEPGRLQSMGSQTVGRLSDFTFTFHFHALEKEMATLQCSCLENPRDGEAWWAAVYGVAQSQTRLKWLSSSMVFFYSISRWQRQTRSFEKTESLLINCHDIKYLLVIWKT